MKENRTKIRFDVSLAAQLQGSATNHSARISDLSKGGCYVDAIAEVIAGQTLSLKLLMPDGKWLELQGVVAHHNPRLGFGVRFVNLKVEQHDQIRALLNLQDEDQPESPITAGVEPLVPLEQIDLTSSGIM